MESHAEQTPNIVDSIMTCTWQTLDPGARADGVPLVFDIKTTTVKKLFSKLKKQLQRDSTKEDIGGHVEELLRSQEAPSANPIPLNICGGGLTPKTPTLSVFNSFATCGPTTPSTTNPTIPTLVGGPNPMPFGLPHDRNYGFNLGVVSRLSNYYYGFNGGFPYGWYPVTSHHLNHTMQYPMVGNPFGFGGLFALPFTDRTSSVLTPSNNFGGVNNNTHKGK
eukprot:Gb_00140 [translate_table: standard]